MSANIKEKEFWTIIEKMDWGSDFDYNRISEEIVNGIYGDLDKSKAVLNMFEKKYSELHNYAMSLKDDDYEAFIDKSDDGLSDLIAHIVGLGKKSFTSIKNPKDFYIFTDTEKESFRYSFHGLYDILDNRK
jgi:hypothetical protein